MVARRLVRSAVTRKRGEHRVRRVAQRIGRTLNAFAGFDLNSRIPTQRQRHRAVVYVGRKRDVAQGRMRGQTRYSRSCRPRKNGNFWPRGVAKTPAEVTRRAIRPLLALATILYFALKKARGLFQQVECGLRLLTSGLERKMYCYLVCLDPSGSDRFTPKKKLVTPM